EPDLNRRPSGYEPDELPDCSIPRLCGGILQRIDAMSTPSLEKPVPLQVVSLGKSQCCSAVTQAWQGLALYRAVRCD
ncbi:hypothetical protein, partial [Pseudomonas sp. SWRI154]|uniref:hypothetical protein n=1 Tax=Pseudomonas sp. SWRI154 TaxID=2745501 RepID=UPI001EE2BAE3